jgi:hypothetical protein
MCAGYQCVAELMARGLDFGPGHGGSWGCAKVSRYCVSQNPNTRAWKCVMVAVLLRITRL